MRQQQLEQQEENKAEQEAASGGADDGSTAQERTTASYVEAYSECKYTLITSPCFVVLSCCQQPRLATLYILLLSVLLGS